MSSTGATRPLKAKIIIHADDSNGTPWRVRLNPTNLDLTHPGNTPWFLEFGSSAVTGPPIHPTAESDLERSTFELSVTANVENCHDGLPCQSMTVAEFFLNGAKYQPASYNSDTRDDPNGNIGDPTSRSSLC